MVDSSQAHDETANEYDRLTHGAHWYPEMLFGLCFEYVSPGQRLLALGIGTGLCVEAFSAYGLSIAGIDHSAAMLSQCRAKAVADELVEHDLRDLPWPWPSAAFDAVLASGVLHFVDDLDPLLAETCRLVRPGGVVALTTRQPAQENGGDDGVRWNCEVIDGVPVYAHRRRYLDDVFTRCGLVLRKEAVVIVSGDPYMLFVTTNLPGT